ncbi:hypothetical protein TSUD_348030 [Trifolium subterraneum]|nr:hypothetical protein TSUD_348030 [Trifolium subterraneum]
MLNSNIPSLLKSSSSFIMDKARININVRWEAPRNGWISLNTDGAVQHGVAGCGGVLRDYQGNWITGFSKFIGTASVFKAELWGVYAGLCLARQRGINNIELQIDSLAVVRNLGGDSLGSSEGKSLVRRVRK